MVTKTLEKGLSISILIFLINRMTYQQKHDFFLPSQCVTDLWFWLFTPFFLHVQLNLSLCRASCSDRARRITPYDTRSNTPVIAHLRMIGISVFCKRVCDFTCPFKYRDMCFLSRSFRPEDLLDLHTFAGMNIPQRLPTVISCILVGYLLQVCWSLYSIHGWIMFLWCLIGACT
jgi:hypothetical protein